MPSVDQMVERLAAGVLVGRTIITVLCECGTDQPAIQARLASRLLESGVRTCWIEGRDATPERLKHAIEAALCLPAQAFGTGIAAQISEILQVLNDLDSGGRLALIINEADCVAAAAFCYLWLMIGLLDLGRTSLQLILIGGDGSWNGWEHAGCGEMRAAADVYRMHRSSDSGASRLAPPRYWRNGEQTEATLPAASLIRANVAWLHRAYRAASHGLALAILSVGLLAPTEMGARKAPPEYLAVTEAAPISPPNLEEAESQYSPPPAASGMAPDAGTATFSKPPDAPVTATPTAVPEPVIEAENTAGARNAGRDFRGSPGLVLVAEAGDTLLSLYARVYRGLKPPPYAMVLAANQARVAVGTIIVFPAPPNGWASP